MNKYVLLVIANLIFATLMVWIVYYTWDKLEDERTEVRSLIVLHEEKIRNLKEPNFRAYLQVLTDEQGWYCDLIQVESKL